MTPHFAEAFDFFQLGLEKWDKAAIESQPQAKILFLDNYDSFLGIFAYDEDEPHDPAAAFTIIPAQTCSFILMENHLDSTENILLKTAISDAQHARAKEFKEAGAVFGLPLKDYMLISPYGFYSATENELAL